jgi:N-acetylmuramoyl-L-alanine amidase
MFKKFFEAIGNLFKSLFGGGKKETKPTPRPRPVQPAIDIRPEEPQDASEVEADDVLVSPETPPILIDPTLPDRDFDEDLITDGEEEDEVPTSEDIVVEPTADPTEEEMDPAPTGEDAAEEPKHEPRFLWCLDNGHGSLQAGKRSPVFDDGETQLFEYEFNRDIVKRMIEKLDAAGVKYFNVVPEVEVGSFLRERVDRANKKKSDLPKLYVSIHANAASTAEDSDWTADHIKGIETWHYHNSSKGKKLAAVFQRHLIEHTGMNSRGLKSRSSSQFYVLRATRMTSVLTENGFYNNKQEALELMKDEVRQQIADAHVAAILEVEKNGIV